MKANAAGMPEWQREYLPMGYGSASGIVTPTRDGGYVVVGAARSIGYVTGLDGWLLKLDHRGSVEWSRPMTCPETRVSIRLSIPLMEDTYPGGVDTGC